MGGFQSTSPVRGTTLSDAVRYAVFLISIHVPREGDDSVRFTRAPFEKISIHVPREGDDSSACPDCVAANQFQSTSPVRGTTGPGHLAGKPAPISIHVPREGDDPGRGHPPRGNLAISIHVPREGDDNGG